MKLNIEKKNVWFKILSRPNPETLECVVSLEKKLRLGRSLNNELVERGLSFIEVFDQNYPDVKNVYSNYYKTLIQSEKKAQKKRAGVWYEPSQWDLFYDRLKHLIRKITTLNRV